MFANINFSTSLQELSITSIHNFKSLFSHSTLSFFPSLEELSISDCTTLEEVIGGEKENVQETTVRTIIFPRLKYLSLSNLQNILTFCHSMSDLELPSLDDIDIRDCPLMETFVQGISSTNRFFFNEKVFCPRLEYLQLEKLNIEGIFRHNSIDNFCQLRYLSVEDCEELQEVIAKEDEEDSRNTKETLSSQLVNVMLKDLPKIQTFWPTSNHLQLPSLQWVHINGDCHMLERFSLGSLDLPSFKGVEGLFDDGFAAKFFYNKEKSSLEIQSENNCFTISARDLSINPMACLSWISISNSSDSFVDVASLDLSKLVAVTGKFEMMKLSAEVVYEVIFMIMLMHDYNPWEVPAVLTLTLPGGEITQHRTETLHEKPTGEWIEILVGEFTRDPRQIGDLKFSLHQPKQEDLERRIRIKGARIQMKA